MWRKHWTSGLGLSRWTIEYQGFACTWRNWSRGCISSTNFLNHLNSELAKFKPTWGLRQNLNQAGCFVRLVEVRVSWPGYSQITEKKTWAASYGLIKGCSPCNGAIYINHLLFSNESIPFSSNKEEDIDNLFGLVTFFEEALGLHINYQKSEF